MDQLCYIMKTAAAPLSAASVPGGSAFSAEMRDKTGDGKGKERLIKATKYVHSLYNFRNQFYRVDSVAFSCSP